MSNDILTKLKEDCLKQGRGRKKWWAEKLNVSPLTLSHWLSGRQHPNGNRALLIHKTFDEIKRARKEHGIWAAYLWDAYYAKELIPSRLFPSLILEILQTPTLDTRTLALASLMVKKYRPIFSLPKNEELQNRLGWFLEISGEKPSFSPIHSHKRDSILQVGSRSGLQSYLCRYQTNIGKKWHVLDCPLDDIRRSFL